MAHSIYLGRLNNEERKTLIKKLWEQQNHKCFITGKEIDLDLHYDQLDIDHVKALANGGKDDPTNFAVTFSYANRSKQASDLNLARIHYQLQNLFDEKQKEQRTNPNLADILTLKGGSKYKLHFAFEQDGKIIKFSFSENNQTDIVKVPVYTDKLSGDKYFFANFPIEYLYHDSKINPRSIGSNIYKLLSEFYKGFPQLQISLGYIQYDEDKTESEVFVFDGQHKTAAQVMLGVREIPVRVFINPDEKNLIQANTHAGTTLKQVAFDKSVQRSLGNTLYGDKIRLYQKAKGLPEDNFAFSEADLCDYFKGEQREVKKYILDAVRYGISNSEDNKLARFIDNGRSSNKPLSYSTIEKTFYSYFINQELLQTNIDYKMEEGGNPRELEKEQIIHLMNIIAENLIIDKFDTKIGTHKLEQRVSKGEDIPVQHLICVRMTKEEIISAWLLLIRTLIFNYFTMAGQAISNTNTLFERRFPEQLWIFIKNFIKNLYDLPLWMNNELGASHFSAKLTKDYWSGVFESGNKVMSEGLDLNKMIQRND